MGNLSKAYILSHVADHTMDDQSETAESDVGRVLGDHLLIFAAGQLSDEEMRSEMTFPVTATIRPVDRVDEENCVEVCLSVGFASVCYHRTFKGKIPGPDKR